MTKKLETEAQSIQKLIDSKKLEEEDLPLLVNEGLSREAVEYYYVWKANGNKPLSTLQKIKKKAKKIKDIILDKEDTE